MVKNPPAMQKTQILLLGLEDTLEKGMATHSSILAWRIPGERSLAGYSPRGLEESDMTDTLTLSLFILILYMETDTWRALVLCSRLHSKKKLVPAAAAAAQSLQSCPTLCDTIHGSPPGSSVSGILQARTLEWVAIAFSEKLVN